MGRLPDPAAALYRQVAIKPPESATAHLSKTTPWAKTPPIPPPPHRDDVAAQRRITNTDFVERLDSSTGASDAPVPEVNIHSLPTLRDIVEAAAPQWVDAVLPAVSLKLRRLLIAAAPPAVLYGIRLGVMTSPLGFAVFDAETRHASTCCLISMQMRRLERHAAAAYTGRGFAPGDDANRIPGIRASRYVLPSAQTLLPSLMAAVQDLYDPDPLRGSPSAGYDALSEIQLEWVARIDDHLRRYGEAHDRYGTDYGLYDDLNQNQLHKGPHVSFPAAAPAM